LKPERWGSQLVEKEKQQGQRPVTRDIITIIIIMKGNEFFIWRKKTSRMKNDSKSRTKVSKHTTTKNLILELSFLINCNNNNK
jgi:hypothetical protein